MINLEYSGFFNSVNGDRKYKADFFAEYFSSFIGNGVFPNPSSNLQVFTDSGMSIIVNKGKGWINGYYYNLSDDLTITLDNADGVLKRIDRVVLQFNLESREIKLKVKKGTSATTPTAPVIDRNADVYELSIASIFIGNGVVNLSQANVTDDRLDSELCGMVTNTVSSVDVSTLYAQYSQFFTDKTAEFEADLYSWLASIQGVVNEDIAVNLMNDVQAKIIEIEAYGDALALDLQTQFDTSAQTLQSQYDIESGIIQSQLEDIEAQVSQSIQVTNNSTATNNQILKSNGNSTSTFITPPYIVPTNNLTATNGQILKSNGNGSSTFIDGGWEFLGEFAGSGVPNISFPSEYRLLKIIGSGISSSVNSRTFCMNLNGGYNNHYRSGMLNMNTVLTSLHSTSGASYIDTLMPMERNFATTCFEVLADRLTGNVQFHVNGYRNKVSIGSGCRSDYLITSIQFSATGDFFSTTGNPKIFVWGRK
jgi:hypothetical protein